MKLYFQVGNTYCRIWVLPVWNGYVLKYDITPSLNFFLLELFLSFLNLCFRLTSLLKQNILNIIIFKYYAWYKAPWNNQYRSKLWFYNYITLSVPFTFYMILLFPNHVLGCKSPIFGVLEGHNKYIYLVQIKLYLFKTLVYNSIMCQVSCFLLSY